ncbi:MAG TPA: response regulator [Azospirillum sp.]|nr:response regulator [Azospirillum sp.]
MQAIVLPSAETLVELLKGVGLLALVSIAYADLEQRLKLRPLGGSLACGLLFGTAAVLAMVEPVHVAPGIIIDARSVMMGLAAPIGGPVTAAVAAAEAAAYRLWLGGAGAVAGTASILFATLVGVAFAHVAKARAVRLRAWHMLLLGLLLVPANLLGIVLFLPPDTASEVLAHAGVALAGMGILGTAFLGTLLLRERRRLENAQALEFSESRYRMLAEHASDAIARIRPDGVLTFTSDAVSKVLGYRPEQLVGRHFADLLHPDDRPDWTAEPRFTGRIRHAAGRWTWIEASVSTIASARTGAPAECVMVVRDVSQRVLAEAALRDSEERYRLLADNVSDVIMRVSPGGVRTYCSGAVQEVLGYQPDELTGGSFLAQVHPADRADAEAAFRRLTPANPRGTGVFRVRHKHGWWTWTEASVRLIPDPRPDPHADTDAPGDFVFVLRDVSERRRMEEDLMQARRTAEQANQAKGTFLATLSHELRTPLNAILGFADLIAREAFGPVGNPQYKQFGEDIRGSGQHLLTLINEILDYSKAEAGHLRLDEGVVDLVAAVRFCARLLGGRAARTGVTLTHQVCPDARYIRADEGRIRQILLNLMSNAVKYTPSGGQVTVSITVDDGAPTIAVSDTGIGIDEKDVPRILEAFEQVENPANRQSAGTGLGLPLTRRLVELHGGSLYLDSRVGEGSTITARLPPERLVTQAPAVADDASPGAPGTILVVDDDPLLREGTALVLEGYGHRVLQAGNGNEALALLRGDEPIDLLLSDVIMPPGMSGVELAEQARRLRPGVPVVLASGFATLAATGGNHDVLTKPFSALDLKAKIDARLVRPRADALPARPAGAPGTARALRVLVVDDLETNRRVAAAILRWAGHVVEEVDDGAAAVEAVRRKPFDVVLMDVQMQGVDGLAATRAIRALAGPAGRTVVLAMTAGTLPEQLKACRDAGMNGHVTKPLDTNGLLNTVEGAITGGMDGRCAPEPNADPVLDEFVLDELRYMLDDGACAALIDDVLLNLPRRLAKLQELANDPSRLDREAHALVSYCGNVGLRRFAAACQDLCGAARDSDPQAVTSLLDTVGEAGALALSALRSYRAAMPIAPAPG